MSRLKPVLTGKWRLIGPSPALDSALAESGVAKDRREASGRIETNAPVDHHIFRARDGSWHLWGCVRGTLVGRVLCHWETESFHDTPWRLTGDIIRAEPGFGESLASGDECIQSPFFVEYDGLHFMFYGGGASDVTGDDRVSRAPFQICLMTSEDGREWVRHKNSDGGSSLFVGPGKTRDPFIMRIGNLWHMYYCGESQVSNWKSTVYLRTSSNLLEWSDWRLVHFDRQDVYANASPKRAVECPVVVRKDEYYYLFRTVSYYDAETHVFRSRDPYNFGIGDPQPNHVCRIDVAAPEIYTVGGSEYVSSSHNPPIGTQLRPLEWVLE